MLASHKIEYQWNWASIWEYREKFYQGWLMTLFISVISLLLSFVFALIFLLLKKSKIELFNVITEFWIQLIRGTPLLVQILIFYYIIGTALHIENRFWVSVIILSNFSAAYMSEILRASLESLPRDHWETARSFGMSTTQSLRYVIFPQVMRLSLPGLAGQLCSLVKDSSLLSIIAVSEFSLNAQEVNAITYNTLESYIPLAFGYLLITLPITLISKQLENNMDYAG